MEKLLTLLKETASRRVRDGILYVQPLWLDNPTWNLSADNSIRRIYRTWLTTTVEFYARLNSMLRTGLWMRLSWSIVQVLLSDKPSDVWLTFIMGARLSELANHCLMLLWFIVWLILKLNPFSKLSQQENQFLDNPLADRQRKGSSKNSTLSFRESPIMTHLSLSLGIQVPPPSSIDHSNSSLNRICGHNSAFQPIAVY